MFEPIFPKHPRSCDLTPGSSRKRLGRHFEVGGRPPPAGQGLPDEYLSYLNDISVAPPITVPTVHEGYPPSAFEPSFPKQQRSCDPAQGSSRKRLGGVIAVLEVILYLEHNRTRRDSNLRRRCVADEWWREQLQYRRPKQHWWNRRSSIRTT